eukprot:350735-Rhodomonas_salina.1
MTELGCDFMAYDRLQNEGQSLICGQSFVLTSMYTLKHIDSGERKRGRQREGGREMLHREKKN